MELIAANIRINAKPTEVLTALTTTDGVRQGWTDDVEMSRDIGAPPIFRFDTIEVTFLIDRIDCHGIEMTCVSHKTRPEWPDTHLAFRVIPGPQWYLCRRASRWIPRQERLLCRRGSTPREVRHGDHQRTRASPIPPIGVVITRSPNPAISGRPFAIAFSTAGSFSDA